MKKAEFTATEGQGAIESSLLYGKKILAIYVDGVAITKFIYSGIPALNEAKITMLQASLFGVIINQVAQFQFNVPMTGGTFVQILYQDI